MEHVAKHLEVVLAYILHVLQDDLLFLRRKVFSPLLRRRLVQAFRNVRQLGGCEFGFTSVKTVVPGRDSDCLAPFSTLKS